MRLPVRKLGVDNLTEFFEHNYKLLSSVGVFIALTVFSRNLQPEVIGRILSALFFTLTIILSLEFISNFRLNSDDWRSLAFGYVFLVTLFVLLIYWLYVVREASLILFFLITFSLINIYFPKLRAFYRGWINILTNRGKNYVQRFGVLAKPLSYLLAGLLSLISSTITILLLIFGFFFAIAIPAFLNFVLDQLPLFLDKNGF